AVLAIALGGGAPALSHHDPGRPVTPARAAATAAPGLLTNSQLRRIARRAVRPGERVRIAVTSSRSGAVRAGASSGPAGTRFRMWSVSRPATVIALLRAHGWRERSGWKLRADVQPGRAAARDRGMGDPRRGTVRPRAGRRHLPWLDHPADAGA